ncbi:MAG: hypothetical protein WBK28_01700 [Minisyncoccia bacterium]
MEDNGSMAEQVEETLLLARENNKILKAMRRDALIGGVVQLLFWALLIGASLYYSAKFLEPYLGMLSGIEGDSGSINALIQEYQNLLGH